MVFLTLNSMETVEIRPRGYKKFSRSTQLSTKIQLLIKTKILQLGKFLALILTEFVFIGLINVNMQTIVCILHL